MDWTQILVIVLAIFLALFLLLGIVLVTQLIRISKQIKSITGSAERAALKFESVASNAAAIVAPATIAQAVKTFVSKAKKSKK